MKYEELMESILTAQEQMLKHSIEANSVTLNGRKYGKLIENLPPYIKPTIFGMTVKADYSVPDNYDFLVQYEPPQPQTNADRTRSMTDEELAEWLAKYCERTTVFCPNFGVQDCQASCKQCWLDWLKQEVTE